MYNCNTALFTAALIHIQIKQTKLSHEEDHDNEDKPHHRVIYSVTRMPSHDGTTRRTVSDGRSDLFV
jgi:hypothetical protein